MSPEINIRVPEVLKRDTIKLSGELALQGTGVVIEDKIADVVESRAEGNERSSEFYMNLGEVAIGHLETPDLDTLDNLDPAPRTRRERRAQNRVIKKEDAAAEAKLKVERSEAVFGVNYGHGEAGKRGSRFTRRGRKHNRDRKEYVKHIQDDLKANRISRGDYNSRMKYVKYGVRRGTRNKDVETLYNDWFQHIAPKGTRKAIAEHERTQKKVYKTANRMTARGMKKQRSSGKLYRKADNIRSRADRHNDKAIDLRERIDEIRANR